MVVMAPMLAAHHDLISAAAYNATAYVTADDNTRRCLETPADCPDGTTCGSDIAAMHGRRDHSGHHLILFEA